MSGQQAQQITARGATVSVHPHIYWHLTVPNSLLTHNAHLGEGLVVSYSAINASDPGFAAATPYAINRSVSPKEEAWERKRLLMNPGLPSRKNAIFLFESEADADQAADTWFAAERRAKVRAQLTTVSVHCIADATWLDGTEEAWDMNASRYWRGEMSDQPRREIIVFGPVFFPDWQHEPFGLIKA